MDYLMLKFDALLIIHTQILAEREIHWGLFQGDALSPLQYVIAKTPFNYIFWICSGLYRFAKSQKWINQLLYIDDIKMSAKIENVLDTLLQTIRI